MTLQWVQLREILNSYQGNEDDRLQWRNAISAAFFGGDMVSGSLRFLGWIKTNYVSLFTKWSENTERKLSSDFHKGRSSFSQSLATFGKNLKKGLISLNWPSILAIHNQRHSVIEWFYLTREIDTKLLRTITH